MGQTYYITDALNVAGRQVNRTVEDSHAPFIANLAINAMWKRYDWRESLAVLPPFYLIPNFQDHGSPIYVLPTDFHGLRNVYRTRTTSVPAERVTISVIKDLGLTHIRQIPHAICHDRSKNALRVFPRVPDNIGATDWIIEGVYKKRPVKVTAAALQNTLIPWDDLYFGVFVDAVKWAAFHIASDPREDKQEQVFRQGLDEMAVNEGFNLGDPSIVPAEPLVDSVGLRGFAGPFIW